MKHTISVLVENKFGALARIAGLFSGRGFNIESLTVSPTYNPGMSKMTIVTSGDDAVIEQVDKQLNRLIDVVHVTDLTSSEFVESELMLLKVKADRTTRSEIMQIATIFKADIKHVHHDVLVLQLTGTSEKLDACIELMEAFGIVELARTGKVALSRGAEATEDLDTTVADTTPDEAVG